MPSDGSTNIRPLFSARRILRKNDWTSCGESPTIEPTVRSEHTELDEAMVPKDIINNDEKACNIIPSPTAVATPQRAKIEHSVDKTSTSILHASSQLSTLSSSASSEKHDVERQSPHECPDHGTLNSWRGFFILFVTCGAQLFDNIFMTGVNIMLPAIQREFGVDNADLQWLISAYTLTFGGFMLLAGAMSDRYGRKNIFCAGMLWLSIWTLADGFAQSFVQLAIFRALQGIGAAMTIPSAVGIISAFFIDRDKTGALTYFGAAGGAGFCLGLLVGGFLTSSLGWRYLFYLSVIVTSICGICGWFVLPKDPKSDGERPKLDILGACISTAGLILISFVLVSGGQYGWDKPFIIVLLILAIGLLVTFVFVERKVRNPIMPLSIWRLKNFTGLWLIGFFAYGCYQTLLYYLVLIVQEIMHLSAGQTALRLIPMGVLGTTAVSSMAPLLKRLNVRLMLLLGLVCLAIAPIPCALLPGNDLNFWKYVFPTSLIVIVGVATTYATVTVVLLASVPVKAKSLCGGMINTGYQIGSAFGLALSSAIVQTTETNQGHGALAQYRVGMWCCVGMAGIGIVGLCAVKDVTVDKELNQESTEE